MVLRRIPFQNDMGVFKAAASPLILPHLPDSPPAECAAPDISHVFEPSDYNKTAYIGQSRQPVRK